VNSAPVETAIEREYSEDFQDRYSEYHAMAQSFGQSEDGSDVTVTRRFDGIVDGGINRYRPLVVVADCATDKPGLERRARWERNVRAGRSYHCRYVFPDILDENGFTWTPGDHHHILDPEFGVDSEMVVTSAEISVSDRELKTSVEFVRPEAYSLLDFPDAILNVVTKKGRPKVKKGRILSLQRPGGGGGGQG